MSDEASGDEERNGEEAGAPDKSLEIEEEKVIGRSDGGEVDGRGDLDEHREER